MILKSVKDRIGDGRTLAKASLRLFILYSSVYIYMTISIRSHETECFENCEEKGSWELIDLFDSSWQNILTHILSVGMAFFFYMSMQYIFQTLEDSRIESEED